MRTRKPRGQALFVVAALALLLACGPGVSRADQAPIRIAHVGATSGIFSSLGVGG